MADERKTRVSFSFSKKASSKYNSKRNALSSDDAKVKEEKWDYIYSAEGKELKRFVHFGSLSKKQPNRSKLATIFSLDEMGISVIRYDP